MTSVPMLRTVEFNPEILKWIELYCFENEMTFSEAMNHLLTLGQQCIEDNKIPDGLPKSQKLLIQCVMETLLILQNSISLDQRKAIGEQAKVVIRKTLNLNGSSECQPS
ncbi:MAG: hypothetical protein BGO43_12050 [Gammaproteobacteria bacterium 39-13]|nr:hypothetical protein [Gammaproteobacteria bacterium]OJV89737.1 MAG: hypothetical protein BGO43_12050 [Gammaproteobacteria bacterium 39-13]